jgi:hypothetical protein
VEKEFSPESIKMPASALADFTIERMGSEEIVIKKTLSPTLSYNWSYRLKQAFRLNIATDT